MWYVKLRVGWATAPNNDKSYSHITKTCLYNVDPLKPHFYIVKLGFTGYTLFFLFLLKNIDCGYSLEPPHRGYSNEYPQSIFWAEIWKISDFFFFENVHFLGVKFSVYLNRRVFVMQTSWTKYTREFSSSEKVTLACLLLPLQSCGCPQFMSR